MEFAGVGAVASIIVNALSLGKELNTLYQTLTDARPEITERITHVRAQWSRTQVQLEIIERIWPSLTEIHRAIQEETLGVLVVKLRSARDKLTGLLKERTGSQRCGDRQFAVKRWKYLFVKSYVDEIIKDLDKWQHMYDPSWYLIIRVANPVIDTELNRIGQARSSEERLALTTAKQVREALRDDASQKGRLSLPSSGLDKLRISSIPYSSARFAERQGKSGLIIESIACVSGSYVGDMDKDVRTLARRLQSVDSATFGVLKCRGVAKVRNSNGSRLVSFDLVLETRTTARPCTLRSCLIARTPHSLTERVYLARQLARAVNYVHTLDFVHKNIRPENWIGFGEARLGSFFLIGFEQVRNAEGMSYFRGDAEWHKNVYRHPSRQGMTPED